MKLFVNLLLTKQKMPLKQRLLQYILKFELLLKIRYLNLHNLEWFLNNSQGFQKLLKFLQMYLVVDFLLLIHQLNSLMHLKDLGSLFQKIF